MRSFSTKTKKPDEAKRALMDWLAALFEEPRSSEKTRIAYLSDAEAASRLRCPVSRIAHLRRTGELPYLPGRPPTIDPAELMQYAERAKREQQVKIMSKRTCENPAPSPATQDRQRIVRNALRRQEREAQSPRFR